MGYYRLLRHRATVFRKTGTQSGEDGSTDENTLTQIYQFIPCRRWKMRSQFIDDQSRVQKGLIYMEDHVKVAFQNVDMIKGYVIIFQDRPGEFFEVIEAYKDSRAHHIEVVARAIKDA